MGGSKTVIQQPAAPAAPTTAQNMADYVANYPALMALEQQYNPQQAALEYQIAQQYGPMYASLYKQTNEQLYPETAKLQEDLAKLATTRVAEGVPESMQLEYLDRLRSEVGDNAGSGIAGDYVSRNMLNQNEEYKNYYNNMRLSLAGRQPLGQYATPTYQNAGEGYNYGQVANNNMQGYGSYAGLYGNMYNAQGNLQASNYAAKMKMYGGLMGMGGAFMGGL